jgi:AcrR family transcriptional regulator
MSEKEQELVIKASHIFLSFGIKSLTMNDLASKLGISKKTLYNYVSDKNDLVKKCILLHIETNECEINEACNISNNAVEQLINFSKIAGEKMKQIHPSIFYDLQKYHPEAWAMIRKFEDKTILELTKENLHQGIKEDLYREDINIELIAELYVSVVQGIFQNTKLLSSGISMSEYYFQIFHYHIRGIANEKGIKLINQYLS